ncbi:hypothetical protein GCM10010964_24990 [Caldovatus sediminis]|uniref:Uncharacterized protein n=1 Tax=Caldovatus sediminis TaxID=2041189 RepID=A0A8J2ZC95_9PROT|nr:hypothetical protein GCM10010964_24990 [Caldovatus sediminis]
MAPPRGGPPPGELSEIPRYSGRLPRRKRGLAVPSGRRAACGIDEPVRRDGRGGIVGRLRHARHHGA